jgi:hypothetical protein
MSSNSPTVASREGAQPFAPTGTRKGEHIMTKLLALVAMAFGATILPARAFAADAPQRLSDAQLDKVVGGAPPAFVIGAGHGPPWLHQPPTTVNIGTQVNVTFQDVSFTVNAGNNSPVNLATALQLSVLGQQPQAASATAVQTGH